MGMGRSFHHWGAKVEKLRSRDKREPFDEQGGLWQQSGVVKLVCRPE